MVCTKRGFCGHISLRNNALKSCINSITSDLFKVQHACAFMGEVPSGMLPKVIWPQKSLLLVPLPSHIILAGPSGFDNRLP